MVGTGIDNVGVIVELWELLGNRSVSTMSSIKTFPEDNRAARPLT